MNIKMLIKRLLWTLFPGLYHRLLQPVRQEFSIAVVTTNSPFKLKTKVHSIKPTITRLDIKDVPALFVADPFMCKVNEYWYLFFEVLNHLNGRGEIGFAVSKDTKAWEYRKIILHKPYHLSYPYVFEFDNEVYMIPEGGRGGAVKLYKASCFPENWVWQANLLEGRRFADSSIFRHKDNWWLFTDTGKDSDNPVLKLYFSKELLGPWEEHPNSPILKNNRHQSRPAGRVIKVNGNPVRFAQDVYPVYGKQVYAFEITELTKTTYAEREIEGGHPIISAGESDWNKGGMHHIDAHKLKNSDWVTCVDGFKHNKVKT